jgi:hypothetical protein
MQPPEISKETKPVMFRRSAALAALMASAMLISACGKSEDKAASASSETSVDPSATPAAPAAPMPNLLRQAYQGQFKPTDAVATAHVGPLSLSPVQMIGDTGLSYDTMMAGTVTGADKVSAAADAKTFADLLGVPADSTVEIRRVMKESYTDWKKEKSFCADKTPFLAVGKLDGDAGVKLVMGAFDGADAPGPQAAASNFCKKFGFEGTAAPAAADAAPAAPAEAAAETK